MPEKQTLERARRDKREGKAPTTQAGEFIREEMHHVREGKHGAKSAKQVIAIGLSKARRAGVALGPPPRGTASKKARRSTKRAGRGAASHQALSQQAKQSSRKRGASKRHEAAKKAARTRRRKAA